ncbi:unnamed protein product, partial [Choristocarpus tenellus]
MERDEVEREVQDGNPGERKSKYWDTVEAFVLAGKQERAATMLRRHTLGGPGGEAWALARQLETMPLVPFANSLHADAARFRQDWARWRRGCKESSHKSGDQRLQMLWMALCGNQHALESLTHTWYDLLIANLLFSCPGLETEDLPILLDACVKRNPPHSSENFLIEILKEVSMERASTVLRFCQEQGSTLALSSCAAHLTDLLIEARVADVPASARGWMFTRLAERLETMPCGWEVAASYLSKEALGGASGNASGEGGEEGAELLKLLAGRAGPGSERSTHEFVFWCQTNGLKEEAIAACRERGVAFLGGGLGGEGGSAGRAAYWLGRAGDLLRLERLCADVSERLVRLSGLEEQCTDIGYEDAEGVLEAIPPHLEGEELVFLRGYNRI